MKHINRFVMLRNIENPPLSEYVDTNFHYTGSYNLQRLPVTRLKS